MNAIEPLIQRKIFSSEEEAIQELLREYILRQVVSLEQQIDGFERKHGMRFQQFSEYLRERSILLGGAISPRNNARLWAKPLCRRKTTGLTGKPLRKC
jgi:hypothetical protein